MFMTRYTRRGPELRFEADKGGAAGAGSGGSASSETPVSTPATPAAPESASLSAEFLRLIPGGEHLIPKEDPAPAPGDKAPAAPGEPPASEKKPDAKPGEEDEIPETEREKPHIQKMQKRIDKLTAQRSQAREELDDIKAEREALRQQLEQAQAGKAAAPLRSENPLAAVRSLDKLEEAIAHAEKVREWALKNRDGATIKDGDAEREVSAEEMTNVFLHHDDILRKHAPAQRAYLKALEEQSAKASAKYPWLADKNSEEFQLRQQVLRAVPELMRFPDFESFVGQWIRGYMAEKTDSAKAAQPPKKETPLAPTPPLGGSPTPKVPTQAKTDAALERLKQNPGSVDALAQFFASTNAA